MTRPVTSSQDNDSVGVLACEASRKPVLQWTLSDAITAWLFCRRLNPKLDEMDCSQFKLVVLSDLIRTHFGTPPASSQSSTCDQRTSEDGRLSAGENLSFPCSLFGSASRHGLPDIMQHGR
jgi:hypothetical protein